MNRIITYCINEEDGLVYSRVGDRIAIPVLQFEQMLPENNFTPTYELEDFSTLAISNSQWPLLRWTKKIPTELKNRHRKFWGFPPLKEALEDG